MNQIVGDFTSKVGKELLTSINQNQPRMLNIDKESVVSINTNLDRPQARRVTFATENHNIFYLELAMDKTEAISSNSHAIRKRSNAKSAKKKAQRCIYRVT